MMLNEWLDFLQQSGARLNKGTVEDFGDARGERDAALADNILVDLSHYGLLQVSGADSTTYMQGQFTNDVRLVDEVTSQLSGHLSHKGRLYNIFRLFRRGEDYFLCMPSSLVSAASERLRKYILMSKVSLEDAGERILRFGISGPQASQHLAEVLTAPLPTTVDGVSHHNGLTVIRTAGPHDRYEMYGEQAVVQPLWQKLVQVAKPAGADTWALLDIHAGLPGILPENVEAFVPQMVNLQLVNGVSFKKGCYTGQEVVARMQYLGNLKRRMYRAHVETENLPVAGTELYCSESESGQGAGRVVNAQYAPEGGCDLLVVTQVALAEKGAAVHIENAQGARLEFRPLPYALPSETGQAAGQ